MYHAGEIKLHLNQKYIVLLPWPSPPWGFPPKVVAEEVISWSYDWNVGEDISTMEECIQLYFLKCF